MFRCQNEVWMSLTSEPLVRLSRREFPSGEARYISQFPSPIVRKARRYFVSPLAADVLGLHGSMKLMRRRLNLSSAVGEPGRDQRTRVTRMAVCLFTLAR